ncbi:MULTISPECIES: hypothetical protein [unclassified Brevundimonas]|uniref:hypothetical protein n=1 Tax=unclassified Brevundimonas TaxID=2622653 RepID=UPI0025B916F4|nr:MULTISPECIES: hypothetical protein [unclassified Brevundimonas]
MPDTESTRRTMMDIKEAELALAAISARVSKSDLSEMERALLEAKSAQERLEARRRQVIETGHLAIDRPEDWLVQIERARTDALARFEAIFETCSAVKAS